MSLKNALKEVDESTRCAPPHTLRVYAMNACTEANRHHQDRQLYTDLADKYDRMAADRTRLWAEYKLHCLGLEE